MAEQINTTGPAHHEYEVDVVWTGNTGQGTSDHRSYLRTHQVRAPGKRTIDGSADLALRPDSDLYNPAELLVTALSQCHMLWYLHLAADSGVVVIGYHDRARGTLVEDEEGAGQFLEVVLTPQVTVSDRATLDAAEALHQRTHELCFIARSVNFPVRLEPSTRIAN